MVEQAGRALAAGYAAYMGVLWLAGLTGLHTALLACALLRPQWIPRRARLVLEALYAFINPLIYLVIFQPYPVWRPSHAADGIMATVAWTLFAAIWGTRLLLPRAAESSPAARARMARLCVLGLACLAAFAVNDFARMAWPWLSGAARRGSGYATWLWVVCGLGPLYLIPLVLLNDYRSRLLREHAATGFLVQQRFGARPALAAVVVGLVSMGLSAYRSSDQVVKDRIDRLRPAIVDAAGRYDVDPRLLAAIVYVTQREQLEPLRDHLERFAAGVFLQDEKSHLLLARPFDVSLGVAQIKPITALTALRVCVRAGRQWGLADKNFRDVPQLGREWALGAAALTACAAPIDPVPVNKPGVVAALLTDEGNVAFAAMLLALYQAQWRATDAAWDISGRPEILATLYQIGFEKSHPHAAPRSNAFGDRVAEISHAPWMQERFGRSARSQHTQLPSF